MSRRQPSFLRRACHESIEWNLSLMDAYSDVKRDRETLELLKRSNRQIAACRKWLTKAFGTSNTPLDDAMKNSKSITMHEAMRMTKP